MQNFKILPFYITKAKKITFFVKKAHKMLFCHLLCRLSFDMGFEKNYTLYKYVHITFLCFFM